MDECGITDYYDSETGKKAAAKTLTRNLTALVKRYHSQGCAGRFKLVLLVAIAMEIDVEITEEVKKMTRSCLRALPNKFQQEQMCFRLKFYKPGEPMPLALCEIEEMEAEGEWMRRAMERKRLRAIENETQSMVTLPLLLKKFANLHSRRMRPCHTFLFSTLLHDFQSIV